MTICSPSFETRGLLYPIFHLSWPISFSVKAAHSQTAASWVFCSTLCWSSSINPTPDQLFIPNHSAWLLIDGSVSAEYLSQQICHICWLVLPPPLKKNLENQHHQISYIAFSTQLTIWESSRLQPSIHFYFLQTKYYFECKEMSIIFLSSLKNQWGICESCNNYVLDIEAKNS